MCHDDIDVLSLGISNEDEDLLEDLEGAHGEDEDGIDHDYFLQLVLCVD